MPRFSGWERSIPSRCDALLAMAPTTFFSLYLQAPLGSQVLTLAMAVVICWILNALRH